nr:hypothetical protein [Saprospiraceae bacterium]
MKIIAVTALLALLIIQCAPSDPETSVGKEGWLSGTSDQKFETITTHIGGFARAMTEVSYRYNQLYWAGEDENWDYAAYQLEEMEEALQDGFQRRPLRAASGEHFMEVVMPEMENAISSRDKSNFDNAFELFTAQCNNCHALEEVSFIQVNKPINRNSNIGLIQ